MKGLVAEIGVSLALLGVGAGIAYLVSPAFFESASGDTLYFLGAIAVSVPAITILALRERRKKQRR